MRSRQVAVARFGHLQAVDVAAGRKRYGNRVEWTEPQIEHWPGLRADRAKLASLWSCAQLVLVDASGQYEVVTAVGDMPDEACYLGTPINNSGQHWFAMASDTECTGHLADAESAFEAHVVATAVALTQWHRATQYCSRCGRETLMGTGGWQRICAGGHEHFPRHDPAMIVLITDESDRILLARNVNWAKNRFSLLAGFVEAGESVEQTVIREVAEEVGIQVTDVRILASQPWPYPRSLMIGCSAKAIGGELRPNQVEIADARYFTRDELRGAVSEGLLLSRPNTIARRLIEQWLASETGKWPPGS